MRTKYLNQWFIFDFNGTIRRAKCIDVEFCSGLGPVFLFETKFNNRFWLTRKEIRDHELSGNNGQDVGR